jgi:hypothetical protein
LIRASLLFFLKARLEDPGLFYCLTGHGSAHVDGVEPITEACARKVVIGVKSVGIGARLRPQLSWCGPLGLGSSVAASTLALGSWLEAADPAAWAHPSGQVIGGAGEGMGFELASQLVQEPKMPRGVEFA